MLLVCMLSLPCQCPNSCLTAKPGKISVREGGPRILFANSFRESSFSLRAISCGKAGEKRGNSTGISCCLATCPTLILRNNSRSEFSKRTLGPVLRNEFASRTSAGEPFGVLNSTEFVWSAFMIDGVVGFRYFLGCLLFCHVWYLCLRLRWLKITSCVQKMKLCVVVVAGPTNLTSHSGCGSFVTKQPPRHRRKRV